MEKEQYMAVSKIGEVISDSSLAYGYNLPQQNPREIKIHTQNADSGFLSIIRQSAIYSKFKMHNFLQKQKDNSIEERLMNFINDRAFQFNSREKFRNHEQWREIIKENVAQDKPINIIIPIFCNIGNPLKRFQTTQLSAAEKVTLFSLYNISEMASKIYPPGIQFHVVVDSNFYSTPFGVNTVETNNYLKQIKEFVFVNTLSNRLNIIDITELLSSVSEDFSKRYGNWLDYFSSNRQENDIKIEERENWRKSMKSSINLRQYNLTYKDFTDIYTEQNNEIKNFVDDLSEKALIIYRSLKYAAADLHWENIHFTGAIRSTIHSKTLPVLGLRIYPEYKLRSRLLPYHGIAVFYPDSKTQGFKMEILPEAIVCTKQNITRIIDEKNVTQGYVSNEDRAPEQ